MFTVDPKRTNVVLTPDGGVIPCANEEAAQRVCAELNERDDRLAELMKDLEFWGVSHGR